jgi:hyperosmotically inducible protein
MLKTTLAITLLAATLAFGKIDPSTSINRQVHHELVMLPHLDVFDNLTYRIDGGTVTLGGQVIRPNSRKDAERAVKQIAGVQKVVNKIEVLPVSRHDDHLRLSVYRAIYGSGPLKRYALPVIKPIRIIVKNGNVTLEGVVDNQADKNIANIRTRGVYGAFSVTNNLVVAE